MAKTHLEIERRWLLSGLPGPEILLAPSTNFIYHTSIYIHLSPHLEVRIQKRVNHKGPRPGVSAYKAEITYPVVSKFDRGMVRQESPKLLVNELVYEYYYYSDHRLPRIPVQLWEIPLSTKILEIKKPDRVYLPPQLWPQELVLAELEFDTVEEADAFKVKSTPAWFQELAPEEVTNDPRYNMRNLAVYGIPNPR